MQVFGFPSAVFGTNCYVIAPSTGDECLVVDPGIDILDQLGRAGDQGVAGGGPDDAGEYGEGE